MLFVGNPVVQSAFVVNDVPDDPGGGAAADNQEDFGMFTAPGIPETVHGLDKAALGRCQAGQFVNEYDQPFARDEFLLKQAPERFESIHPGSGLAPFVSASAKVFRKGGEFFLLCPSDDAGRGKCIFPAELAIHKKSLSHASSAIDGNEFRLSGIIVSPEFGNLFLPTEYMVHIQ